MNKIKLQYIPTILLACGTIIVVIAQTQTVVNLSGDNTAYNIAVTGVSVLLLGGLGHMINIGREIRIRWMNPHSLFE